MASHENLDLVLANYRDDPFALENRLTIEGFVGKCIDRSSTRTDYLELGIGHGYAIRELAAAFERLLVIEGSPELVHEYRQRYANVEIVETYFEEFSSARRWTNIGMGFVLEHVDDPRILLRRYGSLLEPGGSIFVGVPNARSLHRLLGHQLGLLPDLGLLSDVDRGFGHRRFLTYHQWIELFESEGYRVVASEGLYLKPFTSGQIQRLGLPEAAHRALLTYSAECPSLSNSCFFELAHAR